MREIQWKRHFCTCPDVAGDLHKHFRIVQDGKAIRDGYATKEFIDDEPAFKASGPSLYNRNRREARLWLIRLGLESRYFASFGGHS